MKILGISGWGSCTPLLMEMQKWGHQVRMFIKDKDSKDVGEGFVPHVDDYKESLAWADYVISDDTGEGKLLDSIRKKGIPCLGGSELTDQLEVDRHMGQKLFKAVGLSVPESKEFKKIEEALEYVRENPKPYVIKLSGEAQNDKSTTYVGDAEDGSDIIPVVERMAKKFSKGLKAVEIQEKVDGLEVAVSAFFNGKEFVGPSFINFEHKRLLPGPTAAGWGPNTGEMGTTQMAGNIQTPIFKKLIAPMKDALAKLGYHGDFDLNAILTKEGELLVLECTNRFGWPALPLQLETIKENDLGEFFYKLAAGEDAELETSYPLSLCLVIGVPPLPYMNDEIFEKYSKDMPVIFRNGEPQEGMYPGECKLVDGQWTVAGSSGCLAVCASGGHSIEECSKAAYELADQIIVPNKFVRNDIGKYTEESLEKLSELGLIDTVETADL